MIYFISILKPIQSYAELLSTSESALGEDGLWRLDGLKQIFLALKCCYKIDGWA